MTERIYGDGQCAMPDCGRTIPDNMLMCRPHWFSVPVELRNDVWSKWKRWQGNRITLDELRHAQEAAIAAATAAIKRA